MLPQHAAQARQRQPDTGLDRAKRQAQLDPLDGRFRDNVVVQIKNGPLDFMPREPFSPLFGAMPRTRLALELQITQEYLGCGLQLAFLAPQWAKLIEQHIGWSGFTEGLYWFLAHMKYVMATDNAALNAEESGGDEGAGDQDDGEGKPAEGKKEDDSNENEKRSAWERLVAERTPLRFRVMMRSICVSNRSQHGF